MKKGIVKAFLISDPSSFDEFEQWKNKVSAPGITVPELQGLITFGGKYLDPHCPVFVAAAEMYFVAANRQRPEKTLPFDRTYVDECVMAGLSKNVFGNGMWMPRRLLDEMVACNRGNGCLRLRRAVLRLLFDYDYERRKAVYYYPRDAPESTVGVTHVPTRFGIDVVHFMRSVVQALMLDSGLDDEGRAAARKAFSSCRSQVVRALFRQAPELLLSLPLNRRDLRALIDELERLKKSGRELDRPLRGFSEKGIFHRELVAIVADRLKVRL